MLTGIMGRQRSVAHHLGNVIEIPSVTVHCDLQEATPHDSGDEVL